jgi:hypothetical protein
MAPDTEVCDYTLFSKIEVAGGEVTQGIAENASIGGSVAYPNRRTFVRVYLDYKNTSTPIPPKKALLRAFRYDEGRCQEELLFSPIAPINAGGTLKVPEESLSLETRRLWGKSMNFELDPSWTAGGAIFLRLEDDLGRPAYAWPTHSWNRPDYGGFDVWFQEPEQEPTAQPDGHLRIRFFRIPWKDSAGALHWPGRRDVRRARRELRLLLPFSDLVESSPVGKLRWKSDLTLTNQRSRPQVATLVGKAHEHLMRRWAADAMKQNWDAETNPPPVYLGILKKPAFRGARYVVGGGLLGVAVAIAGLPSVASHEVAHAVGVQHPYDPQIWTSECQTQCVANGDLCGPCGSCTPLTEAPFPFPDIHIVDNKRVATIGPVAPGQFEELINFGLRIGPDRDSDRRIPRPIPPKLFLELMSYCSTPRSKDRKWTSQYTAQSIRSDWLGWDDDIASSAASSRSMRLYMGHHDDVALKLDPVWEFDSRADAVVSHAGDFTLQEYDGSGSLLREITFASTMVPAETPEHTTTGHFALPLLNDPAVRRVEVRYLGVLVDAIDASANAPSVQVTYPDGGETLPSGTVVFTWDASDIDGDDLVYSVDLSVDGGTFWRSLARNLETNSLELETADLPAGTQALVRVAASDGFWNSSDTSDGAFEIPDDLPVLLIMSPPAGAHYSGSQLIHLVAEGYDMTDGRLDGDAIRWTSSQSGHLGNSRWLTVRASELAEGTHVLTARATDSSGLWAEDTVEINIPPADGSGPPIANLTTELDAIPSWPRVSDPLTITSEVFNDGPVTATNVSLMVVTPPELSISDAAPSQGTCSQGPTTTCDLGDLEAGAVATVTLEGFGSSEGVGLITASVSADEEDPLPSSAEDEIEIEVRSLSDPDADGDGYTPGEGDCDDSDPEQSPALLEGCNGFDDDCDGVTDEDGDALCTDSVNCTVGTCLGASGCQIDASDMDGDTYFDPLCGGTDCDDSDGTVWGAPGTVTNLQLAGSATTTLSWEDQSADTGNSTLYDVVSGDIDTSIGFLWNESCLYTGTAALYVDARTGLPPGDTWWYLVRCKNSCGVGSMGSTAREQSVEPCP